MFGLSRKYYIQYLFLTVFYFLCKYVQCATEIVDGGDKKEIERYQVAQFNFEHVSDVYAITLWILLGSLAKVGFHLSKKITEKCPESCLLIILGLVVGGLLYATKLAEQKAYVLNADTFLLFLLPPIILEAGYFMPNRPFFDNVGTILLFAIVNTLFNTICIGATIYAFNDTGLYGDTRFEMLHCFVFAALISAVDPVAVLATFIEIHVNDMLYIIVFGESLLNDAVSVVLYRLFDKFSEMGTENILPVDIILGSVSFFVVAIGGVLIGIIFGVIACFTTKFTEHTPVLEPLIILTYSYLSYLTAEMFSTSGILAITFCGMFMKQYVEYNIAKKSNATIEYVLKMLASIMETIIFMFMGLSTVSDHHSWNTGFVLLVLVACAVYRLIGVIIFANIANRWRLLELKFTDMLIMSYGGIRGAVAFALALILDESKIPRKKEFVTATIAVVFFTVFIQGTTIGPIVKYLRIKKKEEEEPTMSAKLTNRLIDHVMSAFEDITGIAGKHSLRDRVRSFDRNYLKRILLREKIVCRDQNLLSKFKKINELNIARMAESDDFNVLPQNASIANMRNLSIANFLAVGLSEIPTIPDFQVFDSAPSKRFEEDSSMHHLLDTAMYDARRRTHVHKRSQLDDEPEPEATTTTQFHHRKRLPLRPMMDAHNIRMQKRKSNAHLHATMLANANKPKIVHQSHSHTPASPTHSGGSKKSSKRPSVEHDDASAATIHVPTRQIETNVTAPMSPQSDTAIIPPPWKLVSEEAPIVAEQPAWASNPDYTVHATTTKKDDSTHTSIRDVFGKPAKEHEHQHSHKPKTETKTDYSATQL